MVVVPRTTNSVTGLDVALSHAGVVARPLEGGQVEVAGTSFAVDQRKVVRESDAMLMAHLLEIAGYRPTFVIADRISEAARVELSRAGMAWWDRRGHLWIRCPGLYVNAAVPAGALPLRRRVVSVFRGAGLDVALALLSDPVGHRGVHELARMIDRSPGRVSEILTELRSQGLVAADNSPIVPELFWVLAEEWKPRWTPLPNVPMLEIPDRVRLSGTQGALALGAPIVTGGEGSPPHLYVADDSELATVQGIFGTLPGATASVVAVCPSRFGFTWGSTTRSDGVMLANHLVIALDLAKDRARGRESLDRWNPSGLSRVW